MKRKKQIEKEVRNKKKQDSVIEERTRGRRGEGLRITKKYG